MILKSHFFLLTICLVFFAIVENSSLINADYLKFKDYLYPGLSVKCNSLLRIIGNSIKMHVAVRLRDLLSDIISSKGQRG